MRPEVKPHWLKIVHILVRACSALYMDKLCCRIGLKPEKRNPATEDRVFTSPTPLATGSNDSRPTSSPKTRLATLAQIGEDWLYLALLGTIMAMLSFSMDSVITLFLNTRLWLFHDLSEDNVLVQYLGWCITPIVLVTFSSGFVHLCSPTVSSASKI